MKPLSVTIETIKILNHSSLILKARPLPIPQIAALTY